MVQKPFNEVRLHINVLVTLWRKVQLWIKLRLFSRMISFQNVLLLDQDYLEGCKTLHISIEFYDIVLPLIVVRPSEISEIHGRPHVNSLTLSILSHVLPAPRSVWMNKTQ